MPNTSNWLAAWIIPAYAGNTPGYGGNLDLNKGSSPHTRGTPNVLV